MPELKRIQHEKFCRAVIEKPSLSQAYSSVYKTKNPEVSTNQGSRLLGNVCIRNRIIEIMRENNIGEAPIIRRLNKWIYDDSNPSVSMDGIKTALKIFGAFDDDDKASSTMIQVNILTA